MVDHPRRATDRPLTAGWRALVVQAGESRYLLAAAAVVGFSAMAILSWGVIEQGHQFQRSAARQTQLLEINNRHLEKLNVLAERIEGLAEDIEDCTTPEGDCFAAQLASPQLAELLAAISTDTGRRIACILAILPVDRTGANITNCLLNGGQP